MAELERTDFDTIPSLLIPWFQKNARELPWRQDQSPYHVWISEIMLQQTRVEAVRGYYLRFLEALPDIESLALAKEETVLKLWEGLGYYSRARNLQKAAQKIMQDFGGVFPTAERDVLSLPGIGAYTAGAILSICFGKPVPAVDGNVLRLWSRLTASYTPINHSVFKREVTLSSIYPEEECGTFTQSLMELGATVCIPKSPRCTLCPLSSICQAYKKGVAKELPKTTPKKGRRKEKRTVFYLFKENQVALLKRKADGLLAGLWELPNVEGYLSPIDAVMQAQVWGVVPEAPLRSAERTHIFTHIEWDMVCYYIPCRKTNGDFIWTERQALKETVALPTAFRMFLEDRNNV